MKRLPIRTVTTLATAAVVGLALLTAAPNAQARRGWSGDGPSPERATERLTRDLDLSEGQQEQVQEILEQSFANRNELRQRHRDDMDAMRQATEEQLAGVLTGEQMDELRELKQQRGERRGDCGRCGERFECDDCGQRGDGDCWKKRRDCRGPRGE